MSFSILWTKESDKMVTNTNLNMNHPALLENDCVYYYMFFPFSREYLLVIITSLQWKFSWGDEKSKPSTTNDQPQLFRASATFPSHDLLKPEDHVSESRIGHAERTISMVHIWMFPTMVVPPKSSILIGFSIINHPLWGTPIFGNTHMDPG